MFFINNYDTYYRVFHYINQRDYVRTSAQVLQNLNLTLYFLFLYRLKDKRRKRVRMHNDFMRYKSKPLYSFTLSIFTTTFSLLVMLIASKTSLYLPRPNFRTN